MLRPLNPAMAATFASPVVEAQKWLVGVEHPTDRPLINVSQAAPIDPPREGLRQAIAEAALTNPRAHLYGPVLGNGDLREALADKWRRTYGGAVAAGNIAITQGCNQAFVAAVATLAGAGDEVILPTPWYFNHKMWLDMAGARAVPLPTGPDLMPDPERARALITDRTRAISLVSPNNPGGVEYPPALLRAFFDLCRAHGIALLLDETYRDFLSADGAPHDLFQDPNWDDTLIQLYSFSKAYRLTGHRVGAMAASTARLEEVEKFLDTVSISASQLGQIGALWGLRHLEDWLGRERAEVLVRRAAMVRGMETLDGWQVLGSGAYFAYVRHPDPRASNVYAKALVREAGLLMLPGTMFRPEGDPDGGREMRIAFANIDAATIGEMIGRLGSRSL